MSGPGSRAVRDPQTINRFSKGYPPTYPLAVPGHDAYPEPFRF